MGGFRILHRVLRRGLVLFLLLPSAVYAATLPAGFTETQINGLASPTAMEFAPDGRIFVCQQGGSLRVIKNGVLLSTPFLTLSVDANGERGLLGIAFDPNFASNNFLYVYYTVPPRHDTTASVASLRTVTSSYQAVNRSFSSSTI